MNSRFVILPSGFGGLSRRSFIQGMTAAAALGSMGLWKGQAWALAASGRRPELSGAEFDLEVAALPVNFTGRRSVATAVNGLLPGPVLRVREGDTITLRVANRLSEMTAIHWHGMVLPAEMDGVPGISFPGIAPGGTFTYRFTVRQNGTYWYHAHTLQEQTGLYGALIVEPREPEAVRADRDYAVLLSDWTDEDPLQVFLNLKKMGGYYNFGQPTVGDFFRDVSRLGLAEAVAKRHMWNRSRMNPTDISDVSAATYTYLMNGTPPAGNWTAIARAGELVRLRFIGAGTATYFDVRIPGLKLTVVSTDGQNVEPVEVDEFRIGPGETYDVIVRMPDDRAYTIFAQSMDRTGFARGTLAPREGTEAEIPRPDARMWLDPVDMMGAMASMGGAGAQAGHGMPMDAPEKARHARTEYGPAVDMRVDFPRNNLDDPGAGLRDNGRRVLTYADLRSVGGALDARVPGRKIELHLTGNMERFIWSLDGVKLNDAKPIHFREGERLRVTLVNDSTMTHPMHLHGMWSDLESPDGRFQVRKHTVSVQPAQRVRFAVTADAPGRWAFHCHLLYHMAAGMFREVVVA
ncbi:MAG: copper resistance system multicopper oxidase [Desulfobacteria bacterium]